MLMAQRFSPCKHFIRPAVCAGLAAASVQTTVAQDESAAVEAPNVAILGSYVDTDDVRGVDDGHGLQFTMGWALSDVVQLQLNTSYVNFDTGVPATDFYRTAAGVDLVRYFNPRGFAPFVVTGIGAVHNDVAEASQDHVNFTAAAGLGLLSPPFTDYGIRLRGETRAVYDRYAGRPEDVHFSLGLVFPLRRPRTVEVVRTEVKEVIREVTKEVFRDAPQSIRDADKDGVPDERDACPDTLPGAVVDARGCVPVQAVIQLTGVHFEHDSSRLTENSKSILAMAAASLRGQSGMRVEVAGHTDSRGHDAYNLELSQRRALVVVDYLIAAGIGSERLQARGYGETHSVESNDTESGRERNRRVEFRVLPN
jgi:OOP family OmpA-OmpF porin